VFFYESKSSTALFDEQVYESKSSTALFDEQVYESKSSTALFDEQVSLMFLMTGNANGLDPLRIVVYFQKAFT
jgi:hypothetical protein